MANSAGVTVWGREGEGAGGVGGRAVTNSCLIPFEASPYLSAASGSDGKVLDANKVPHMTEALINLLEGRGFFCFFFSGLNAEAPFAWDFDSTTGGGGDGSDAPLGDRFYRRLPRSFISIYLLIYILVLVFFLLESEQHFHRWSGDSL